MNEYQNQYQDGFGLYYPAKEIHCQRSVYHGVGVLVGVPIFKVGIREVVGVGVADLMLGVGVLLGSGTVALGVGLIGVKVGRVVGVKLGVGV